MKLSPLSPLALSLSLLLLAGCVPQTQLQSGQMMPMTEGAAPTAQTTERVSFHFDLSKAKGFRTQFADLDDAAFVSLSLVGDGISGTRTSRRIALNNGEASVSIDGLPIQDGLLRIVTAIAYDSAGEPLEAFVGKGFYTSRRGDSEHRITISRSQWLVGRALELLLASDPEAASAIDFARLQANAEAAFGLSDEEFLFDPSLFNPAGLAILLETNALPDSAAIFGLRVGPGELLAEIGTFNGANIGEALTVRVNDPNSGQQTIPAGSRSPQNLVLDVSPGSWTFEILRADGTVVYTSAVEVDATGMVTSGLIDTGLNNITLTPVIENLSTTATSIGNTLTLSGRGFSTDSGGNTVRFGSTQAVVTPVSTTSLQVTVPPGISGDQAISVEVAGQTSNSANFAVVPVISALTPSGVSSRLNGQIVTLSGTGFSTSPEKNLVRIGDASAGINGTPDNSNLSVMVPGNPYGPYDLTVTVGSQTSEAVRLFYGDRLVNSYVTGQQFSPAIAMDADGDFVIAWQSFGQDGGGYGIYAQRYTSAGNPAGSEFQVNTYTLTEQARPKVAMDADGNFVIAWQSQNQDGNSIGIYAQRFNAAGTPQLTEFRVNTYTTNSQQNPAIAMDADGDFVIAWQSDNQDGNSSGIYAQRFNAAGTPQLAEFRGNTFTSDAQTFPSVGMDSDGDFVVTWQSANQDGSSNSIYAQRFNAAGTPQLAEFRVNAYTSDAQSRPSIAMDNDGDFVIAWQSDNQDGYGAGIYAQRFNAAGTPQLSEFRVNTYTRRDQSLPWVAIDNDGDFAVCWSSDSQGQGPLGQDNSYNGVYAQRFNSQGQAQGNEFPVNSFVFSQQRAMGIAMDSDGDFGIVWQSNNQDGGNFSGNYGVIVQRFTNTGLPQ